MRRIDFLNRVLPNFYGPLLALLLLFYAWLPVGGGFDVWAHASIGSWIWSHAQVPMQSLYLWGAPPIPWVWHSWLSQLLFYGLMRFGALFGASGAPYAIAIFTVVCVALCFFLLWKLWRRESAPTATGALCFALAFWVSAPRFQPRQEAISAVLLVIVLAYLIAWSKRHIGGWGQEQPRSSGYFDPTAFSLVGLFALWANLHALFALGLLIVLVTALCDALQDHLDRRAQALLVIGSLCLLATFLNPYLGDVWRAAALLKPNSQARFVEEWKSPLLHEVKNGIEITSQMTTYVIVLLALSGIAFIGWLRNGQRRWAHLVWLVMANGLFLLHRRDSWLASIIVMAAICANANYLSSAALWNWWRRVSKQSQTLDVPAGMRIMVRSGAVLCLLLWSLSLFATKKNTLWPLRALGRVPSGAASYIEKKRLPGRIFNDYEYSSYLQWRWNGSPRAGVSVVPGRGRRPLYIDLMSDYPDALLYQYLGVMDGEKRAVTILDRASVNTVILGPHKRKFGLTRYLNRNPKWRRVYDRADGMVWSRVKPLPAPPLRYFNVPSRKKKLRALAPRATPRSRAR